MNSVVIAFIDPCAGEKHCTWRICPNPCVEWEGQSWFGNTFLFASGVNKESNVFYVFTPLVGLCLEHDALTRVVTYAECCVFPEKLAGIVSSAIPILRQAPRLSTLWTCFPQACRAHKGQGYLWYPVGTSLLWCLQWAGWVLFQIDPFPRGYLYFHVSL